MNRNEQVETHDGSEPVRAPAVSQDEQWKRYAASLERFIIANGHPDLVRIASA